MLEHIADNINILGQFCGKRDVQELTAAHMLATYGMQQADVMVLFGGSILCGGDVLAEAMKSRIAKKFIIVGGAGHTTETLRQKMHMEFPDMKTENLSEAEVFAQYIKYRYDLEVDLLECRSTNCGNNITYLLDILRDNDISFDSIILSQDATMQRRMEAGLRKYVTDKVQIINYATYSARVIVENNQLVFANEIWGMWDMDRYINLLMGEIPRLKDDREGYGPLGKNYIAHVDVPSDVRLAFDELSKEYAVRVADSKFA